MNRDRRIGATRGGLYGGMSHGGLHCTALLCVDVEWRGGFR
jgi:hypothetical protein